MNTNQMTIKNGELFIPGNPTPVPLDKLTKEEHEKARMLIMLTLRNKVK